jgi:PAS domain S-box-containing protein
MTGYICDEAVGQNTRIHKSGVHSAVFYKDLWETLGSGRSWQDEITNGRKDGTLYQEDMRITPVRDSESRITCSIAIKKEVTNQRKDEEATRNALEFAQSTIEALSSRICVLDEQGTIIAVNRAWRQFVRDNRQPDSNTHPSDSDDHNEFVEGVSYIAICEHTGGTGATEAGNPQSRSSRHTISV